jgi:hypothetical protein
MAESGDGSSDRSRGDRAAALTGISGEPRPHSILAYRGGAGECWKSAPLAPPPTRGALILQGCRLDHLGPSCRCFGDDLWTSRIASPPVLFSDRPVFSEPLYYGGLVQSLPSPHPLASRDRCRNLRADLPLVRPFPVVSSIIGHTRLVRVAGIVTRTADTLRRLSERTE